MTAIWVTLIGATFIVISTLFSATQAQKEFVETQSQARVAKILAVREAASRWYQANPAFIGVIANANIVANLPRGAFADPDVITLIAGGTLYTYTATAPNPADLSALGKALECSELAGVTTPANSFRPACFAIGAGAAVIPAVIPANRLIIVGK